MIWSGWGLLVLGIVIVVSLITESIVERVFQDEFFYQLERWPLAIALFISGILVCFVGSALNRKSERSERVFIDEETGERVALKTASAHTFFFVKMEYWSVPLLIGAVATLVMR